MKKAILFTILGVIILASLFTVIYKTPISEMDIQNIFGETKELSRQEALCEGIGCIIENDSVYINDSNAYISASPHTMPKSGWVYQDIKSKIFDGEINAIWGFDSDVTKPSKAQYYNPVNETWNTSHTKILENVTSHVSTELACDYGNEYNNIHQEVTYSLVNSTSSTNQTTEVFCFDSYTQNGSDYIINWNTKHWEMKYWHDFGSQLTKINRNLNGKDTWYYISNFNINVGQLYKIRFYLNVKPNSQGKYDFAIYPSSYGADLQSAYNDGNLYLLDPWWNSTYDERYLINQNGSGWTGIGTLDVNITGLYATIGNDTATGQVYLYNDTSTGNWVIANDTTELCGYNTNTNEVSCPLLTGSAEGLFAKYDLDRNSGDVKDYIGGNDGTNNGATRGVTGKINNAFDFEETESDYIDTNGIQWGGTSDSFTWNAWFEIENHKNYNYLFRVEDTDIERLALGFKDTGAIYGVIDQPGAGNADSCFGTTTWSNGWVMGTWVFDSSTNEMTLYLNGSEECSFTADTTGAIPKDIYIGAERDQGGSTQSFYDGNMDNVEIYDKALSGTEVSQLYNSTNNQRPYLEGAETENEAPSVTLNSPEDGAIDQPLNVVLNATVSDHEGDLMNVSFINNATDTVICQNNSISNNTDVLCTWSGLTQLTTYNWYVNVTDNNSQTTTSQVWNFTTLINDVQPYTTIDEQELSKTITSSNYQNITAFKVDPSDYSTANTSFFVSTVFNMENTLNGESVADIRILVNNRDVGNISTSLLENRPLTSFITSKNLTLNTSANNMTILLQARRTSTGTNDVSISNVTTILFGARDTDNAIEVYYRGKDIIGTSSTDTYTLIDQHNLTDLTYNGTLIAQYGMNLEKSTGGHFESYLEFDDGVNQENCSSLKIYLDNNEEDVIGSECLIRNINKSRNITLSFYGKTDAGSTAIDGRINSIILIDNSNKTTLGGETINTTFRKINSVKVPVNNLNENLIGMADFSLNSSVSDNLINAQLRMYNSTGGLRNQSLILQRRLSNTAGEPKAMVFKTGHANLSIDNYTIELWAKTSSGTAEILTGDISGYETDFLREEVLTINDTENPSVSFKNQTPSDLNTTNLFDFNNRLNITYNITDNRGVDFSTIKLYHKTNSTGRERTYFLNGTAITGWIERDYDNSYGDIYEWLIPEWKIYPITHNLDKDILTDTQHNNYTLDTSSDWIKVRLFNTSTNILDKYNYLELMANTTGATSLRIYYCNSSYTTGNLALSPYCVNFYDLNESKPYDYIENKSSYHIIPFSYNTTTNQIGNVKITNTSYFLMRGNVLADWNVYTVNQITRTDQVQTSSDNGVNWANYAGTVDLNLRIFDGYKYRYYACANDTSGNQNCSDIRIETFEKEPLPPTSLIFYSPETQNYNEDVLLINYSNAISPQGDDISNYNISLYHVNETFIKHIHDNNLNNTYNWNFSDTTAGNYKIGVTACDNNSLCTTFFSTEFSISFIEIINVTLNSPSDGAGLGITDVTFNASATTTRNYIQNMSLFTNESGSWELKNSSQKYFKTNDDFDDSSVNTSLWENKSAQYCYDVDCSSHDPTEVYESNDRMTFKLAHSFSSGAVASAYTALRYKNNLNDGNDTEIVFNINGTYVNVNDRTPFKIWITNITSLPTPSTDGFGRITSSIEDEPGTELLYLFPKNYLNNESRQYKVRIDYSSNTAYFYDQSNNLLNSTSINLNEWYLTFEWYYADISSPTGEHYYYRYIHNFTEERYSAETTQTWDRTYSPGDRILWNVQSCDDSGECNFSTSNFTFSIDNTPPTVNIDYPNETIDYGQVGNKEDLNFTATNGGNIDSCWYNYNGTNITLPGCNNGSFTIEDFGYSQDIKVYANDTAGNKNSDTTTFEYRFLETGREFSASAIELSNEKFILNITHDRSDWSSVAAALIYDGTSYSATKTGSGDEIQFTRSLAIPDVSTTENKTFYWTITAINSTGNFYYNTTEDNQTVTPVNIDNCSAYGTVLLNYEFRDEETQELINLSGNRSGAIEVKVEISAIGGGSSFIKYSNKFEDTNTAQVCIDSNLSSGNLVLDVKTKYYADGYNTETYNIKDFYINDSSIPRNITLYDINSSAATIFDIYFKGQSLTAVEGALIDISREYVSEGVFKTVEIPITDIDGKATASLVKDSGLYTFNVYKDRELLATFEEVIPICDNELTGECQINLNAVSTTTSIDDFVNIDDLKYTIEYNETTRFLTLSFATVSGSTSSIRFLTQMFDAYENDTICDQNLESASGTLNCYIPESYSNQTVITKIYKENEPIARYSLSLLQDPIDYFGYTGFFLALIMIIMIPLMFITSTIGIAIGMVVGLIITSLLLLSTGGSLGVLAGGLAWFIVAIAILIWKLNSTERRL